MSKDKIYFSNESVMGAMNTGKYSFAVFLGARGVGKTFSTQNYCLRRFFKYNEPFLWLRLKEPSVQKLLANNAKDFIDSKLIEKWHIESIETKGNLVYINGKEAARIMALSTFYTAKGVALNKGTGKEEPVTTKMTEEQSKRAIQKQTKKYRTIVLDELNRERCEKNTLDVSYAFVNTIETVCRLDTDRRIFLLGNTLEEGSDICVGCFNFIPNSYGTFKIPKKRAIISLIRDSKGYKEARANSFAGILAPTESTFTNEVVSDLDLLDPNVRCKPTYQIKFDQKTTFVVCGNIVTSYKPSKQLRTIAMRPLIPGLVYDKEVVKQIKDLVYKRSFKYDKLYTMKKFHTQIKLLKEY